MRKSEKSGREAGPEQLPLPPSPSPLSSLPAGERPAIAGDSRASLAAGERPALLPRSGSPPPSQDSGRSESDEPSGQILNILRSARRIAVVGASDKPGRPSHRVTFYLIRAGYEVYPVNPTIKELGGRPVFPSLRSVPAEVDVVDIFRRPEEVMPIVEDAIAIGAKVVWMQEGVVNEEAAVRARSAGLMVVMDKCMMKEHRRMLGTRGD